MPPPKAQSRPTWPVFTLLAFLFLTAAWFYAWAPSNFPVRWTSLTTEGFYAELTEAWLHGRLSLLREPDVRLAALNDPYDPAENASLRVNDLSYFHGRYYLYHGPAPVLMLLAPFRLLTGQYLTDPAACLIFCLVGAAFGLALLADIHRLIAPQASRSVLAACALAVLFGSGYHLVLRSSGLNHVAIASAYCFLMLAIWSVGRALIATHRSWPWLLLSGGAYGLAIASRPNYVLGAAALLFVVWTLFRREGGWRAFVLNLTAVALPVIVAVSTLLVHNYLRFGQPLEFGQRYMLGAWDQRQLDFLGFKNVGVNAWYYLIGPVRWNLEFPFVGAPGWQAVGLLIQTPFVWLGSALVALRPPHPDPAHPYAFRSLAGLLGMILLCNLGLLILLPSGNDQAVKTSANARYVFDFLPVAVLLACTGVLGLDHRLAARPGRAWTWRMVTATVTILSLLAALSLDFQRFPAECYRPLAQSLNRPAHLARNWLGETYGPVRFTVVFPVDRLHAHEPLVATGTPEAGDLLYVFYDSPQTIRFGLVGTTMTGPTSPPIPVTYGQPHEIEISMGSLYPAPGNPALASLSDAEAGRLKRTLRISIDGRPVHEVPAHFFPSKSREVRIGSTRHLLAYSASDFSGQISASARQPIAPLPVPLVDGPEYGALRLIARFPEGKTGLTEPLIVSGVPNAGDFIYVHYESDWQIRLGLDHWGHPGLRSPSVPVDYSVNHVVEIHMGSLLPPAGHMLYAGMSTAQVEQMKRRVKIILDGEVLFDTEQSTHESSPYDVHIGRNAIGGSTCGYEFSGEIKSATRLPLPTRR